MKFIGIDLAWSDRNLTGCAYLEGDTQTLTLRSACHVRADAEIVEFVTACAGCDPAIVSIDAPLVVPNETRMRDADALCTKLFDRYEAGAYPANRTRLNPIRGERLSQLLTSEGFVHDPTITRQESSRKFFEVYPHPAMVVLGNLPKTLKYKRKHKRSQETVFDAFEQLEELLGRFLDISSIRQSARDLNSRKLQAYEDQLDAIFCGIIGWYAWNSPEKCMVLGNIVEGYILTPVSDTLQVLAEDFDELRPNYDFDHSIAQRGRYFKQLMACYPNVILLEPDIAAVFKSSESVNNALRAILQERASTSGGP